MYEEEKTITLRKSIVLGTGENALSYDKIELREPLAGEIAKAQLGAATATDVTINLIQFVAKVPRKVVELMPQTEFRACADFLNQTSAAGGEADTQS